MNRGCHRSGSETFGGALAAWSIVVLSFSMYLSGCFGGGTTLPLGANCTEGTQCEDPLVCVYGRCREECVRNADCEESAVCVASPEDPDHRVCLFPDESGCLPWEHMCPGDLQCSPIDQACHEECYEDTDCAEGLVCRGGLCIEEETGVCGDGFCVPPEDVEGRATWCPQDCIPRCGNLECNEGETPYNCPTDCPPRCGDETCSHGETGATCPVDCPPNCGDNICNEGEEDAMTCPADCLQSCGDGICSHWERLLEEEYFCEADCPPECGDTHCTHDENAISCHYDCEPVCGDGGCTHDESHATCPEDCIVTCGNDTCEPEENASTCPGDCPPVCPDAYCSEEEDAETCPEDCLEICGDLLCTHEENVTTCPGDCPPRCGDDFCTHFENAFRCPEDCPEDCGDTFCTHSENANTCPGDCTAICSDGFCTHEEDPDSCEVDCPPDCGDDVCNGSENASSCPDDCPEDCGDDLCTHTEAPVSCPDDCPAVCPDDECTHDEDVLSCPVDCPAVCPDEECTHLETPISCPDDCPENCPDSYCSHTETPITCLADCPGSCPDTYCSATEDPITCIEDCPGSCPDTYCSATEDPITCIEDCPGSCPDTYCSATEDPITCIEDCPGSCPDTYCSATEDAEFCPIDCTECGDTLCTLDETVDNCPGDCGGDVLDISTGGRHTCAVLESGSIRCWGLGDNYRLGYGNPNSIGATNYPYNAGDITFTEGDDIAALAVTGGEAHTCARLEGGLVRCWGDNADGQLGYGADPPDDIVLPGARGNLVFGSGDSATDIDAGDSHTCAVAEGDVYCWGNGSNGRLGNGDSDSRSAPERIADPFPHGTAVQVTAGGNHSCARTSVEQVYCWGMGILGQIGDGNTTLNVRLPTLVDSLAGVTDISAGTAHTCAVVGDRDLYCWGNRAGGTIGDGCSDTYSRPVFVDTDMSEVVNVTAGDAHTCVRLDTADVACWGTTSDGRIGYDTIIQRCFITFVGNVLETVIVGESVEEIDTGSYHTCVQLATGAVRCWGRGVEGQLGHGSIANISDGDGLSIVAAGDVPILGP